MVHVRNPREARSLETDQEAGLGGPKLMDRFRRPKAEAPAATGVIEEKTDNGDIPPPVPGKDKTAEAVLKKTRTDSGDTSEAAPPAVPDRSASRLMRRK